MREKILKALERVIDPETGISVVEMNMINWVKVKGKKAVISFTPTSPFCPMLSYLTNQIKSAAESIEGVEEAEVKVIV